ncbi:MAG TPA: polysaccharide deacetylase family protein [Bacteroidales bacterium]
MLFIKILIFIGIFPTLVFSQTNNYSNRKIIKLLYSDSQYLSRKAMVRKQFAHAAPGHWGEFVKGVDEDIITNKKIIAFTFDACGGSRRGNGYDSLLIKYLKKEAVPATLFVTGKWIDANYTTFLNLAKDTLFEIENHGLNHRPCSVNGESEYGIQGTISVTDAYDEIEANAEKIRLITGRRPTFFRSATAFTDEACAKMAKMLGITVISFDVLSGDAVPGTPVKIIANNVLEHLKPGALVIMHFNHPENNTYEALQVIIPRLRREGYQFSKLQGYPLKGKQ